MAKRLKAPIDLILNRIENGKWGEEYAWSQERFRISVEQHPCEANNAILKAIEGGDKGWILFTIEHLIHLRTGYLHQTYEFIKKARKIDWRT